VLAWRALIAKPIVGLRSRPARKLNLTTGFAGEAKNHDMNSKSLNKPMPAPVLCEARALRCVMLLVMILAGLSSMEGAPTEFASERILVKPKAKARESAVRSLFAKHKVIQQESIPGIDVRVVHVPAARLARVMHALRRNRHVEFAELDLRVAPDATPSDPFFGYQWHLPKIGAPTGWDTTTGSSAITVAVLDSGVDCSHPDLSALIDPGWNFFDNNSDTHDVTGHGTGVAGAAVGSANNGVGIVGVAWNCRILPVRVADISGYASVSAIASALNWSADRGARVANISFRASGSLTVQSAAQYFQSKGGVVAISAGNEGVVDTSPDNPYALTVGATDQNDVLATFSNTGDCVDLSAPGVQILTTTSGGGYGYGSGTSFSAPIVAGVAALALSVNSALSGAQVQSVLKQTADDLGAPGWDSGFGAGRVNAARAVAAAAGTAPIETVPPTVTITSPSAGSTVAGVINVAVTAFDNIGVTRVEWYCDGVAAGSSATAPTTFAWDTRTSANGIRVLQARGYDAAGNVGLSASANVTVQNAIADSTAPTVTITAPTPGTTVSGTVNVAVNATDNVGVATLEWYLDNVLTGSGPGGSLSFSWATAGATNGAHTLQARAYDAAGNAGTSGPVSVLVQNEADTTAPIVRITTPTDGAAIPRRAKTINVYVTSSDNAKVTKVELYADGKLAGSSTSANPVFNWSTSKLTAGSHSLQARAYDAAGNIGVSGTIGVLR
jgi:thermitase